jgi:flagellar biogenesis protein FliO
LAVVLGVFFLVAWALRRAGYPLGKAAGTVLPGEVFEVLGRAPMTGRQQVHLLRCGNKLVLVSVTPAGAETLTEVTDPAEVDRLAGLCRQAHPQSATAAFRQIFAQFAAARPGGGFLGQNDHDDLRLGPPGLPAAPAGLENRHD